MFAVTRWNSYLLRYSGHGQTCLEEKTMLLCLYRESGSRLRDMKIIILTEWPHNSTSTRRIWENQISYSIYSISGIWTGNTSTPWKNIGKREGMCSRIPCGSVWSACPLSWPGNACLMRLVCLTLNFRYARIMSFFSGWHSGILSVFFPWRWRSRTADMRTSSHGDRGWMSGG